MIREAYSPNAGQQSTPSLYDRQSAPGPRDRSPHRFQLHLQWRPPGRPARHRHRGARRRRACREAGTGRVGYAVLQTA